MIRPVHIDGAIFVAIAIFGAFASALGSDDAGKWVDPKSLWFARNACTAVAAGLLALKMYRSTAYAKDVVKEAEKKGDTDMINKPSSSPIKAILLALLFAASMSAAETITRSCVRDGTNYMVHFTFDPSGGFSVPATIPPGQAHFPCRIVVFGNGQQIGTNFDGEVTQKGCFEDRPEDAVANALSQCIKPKSK